MSPMHGTATKTPRPLTHHEILTLIGPFTRRGHHVDLAATRRAERRLVFTAIEHPSPLEGFPILREVLELEAPEHCEYRLVRSLTATDPADPRRCLSATLTAAGPDPGVLLAQVEGFSRERHFPIHGGVPAQCSYRLQRGGLPRAGADEDGWPPILTQAQAEVHGVSLEIDADRGGGMPAHIHLSGPPGEQLLIPQDLLAVLGRPWRPLEDYSRDWRGTIRTPKQPSARTLDMEAKLGRTLVHLAETFSRPPADFHTRHRNARWRATFRRATPLLAAIGLIAATPLVSLLPMGEGSLLRMMIFHAPPLMLASIFLFNEIPRIEIPPLPRPLRYARWLNAQSPRRR